MQDAKQSTKKKTTQENEKEKKKCLKWNLHVKIMYQD